MIDPTLADEQFLHAIREATRIRGEVEECEWTIGVSRWDLTAYLAGDPDNIGGNPKVYPGMPARVVLAKAKSMIERGLVDGCACGCRGDFTVTS